jgi:hypothetical protein
MVKKLRNQPCAPKWEQKEEEKTSMGYSVIYILVLDRVNTTINWVCSRNFDDQERYNFDLETP